MAENAQKNNKTLIIVIIVAAALVIAGLVTVIVLLLGNNEEPAAPVNSIESNLSNGQILYQTGVVAFNEEDLQAAYDEAVRRTKEGYITVDFNAYATSGDGINFDCHIGNAIENTYDCYFDIYLDSSLSERVLLTGLIPPGSGIDTFESEIDIDPGTYEAVLVLTQVEDDHSTLHAQTSVQINLVVQG